MTAKDLCILGAGGWPPKSHADGHQFPTGGLDTEKQTPVTGADFSRQEMDLIRGAIRKKYAAVASSAEGYFRYPVGKAGAALLGYDAGILAGIPDALLNSFCGVGNPFAIDRIEPGTTVLDIGCGAGVDLIVASRLVGVDGTLLGVDLTEEMVDRAQQNLAAMRIANATLHLVSSEQLPFADGSVDVVISNGVINLSPDKPRLFGEIHRVLRPHGRLQFADIILESALPAHLAATAESWSQWIGGAIPGGDQLTLMNNAGLTEVALLGTTPVKTSEYTVGALFRAIKP